ncbi:MAG TPA: hypothetical protein VFA63_00590 [Pseudonocardiaceae bacterium]|nr:hypothetical protein [Pseudonocardiaceae bacterium]
MTMSLAVDVVSTFSIIFGYFAVQLCRQYRRARAPRLIRGPSLARRRPGGYA